MKKLLLLTVFIISIVTANAQWHFSITSMSYNDNCVGDNLQGFSALLEVEVRKQLATDLAAKTFGTIEECESAKSAATTNYSNSGCYIRITTSPCIGGNIGGGGVSGNGIGGSQSNASLYSSAAIGEPYFAPNEAYVVSSMGEDLEIKLAALSKSFNDAVGGRGIKTGDHLYDEQYKNQVTVLARDKKKEGDGEYTFYPRIDKVYLDQENNYVTDDDELIVPIDPERIMNQQRDESLEKSQKEIQHRLDLREKKIQHKMDSISKNQSVSKNTLVPENVVDNTNEKESLLDNPIIASYQVGAWTFQSAEDGTRYIKDVFGVSIPGSEQLSNLNSTLNDLEGGVKEVRDMAVIIMNADLPGFVDKIKTYATDAVGIAIDPYITKAENSINTLFNKYTNLTDILSDVGKPLNKSVSSFSDTVLKGALNAERTGEFGAYEKSLYQGASRFNHDVVEMVEKRINKK